jgi:hypothetical protein
MALSSSQTKGRTLTPRPSGFLSSVFGPVHFSPHPVLSTTVTGLREVLSMRIYFIYMFTNFIVLHLFQLSSY